MSADDDKVQLYLAHRAALVEYALPIVGDRMRAEDVVQEAFIRFVPGPAISQPLGYLYRIVRNLAHDLSRRRATEQRLQNQSPSWWMEPAAPRTPEQELSLREDLERIDAILAELSPQARQAVRMHRLGGHTLQEIADSLGVSLNTAHRLVRDAVVRVAIRLSSDDD